MAKLPFDARSFRSALGTFVTGVTVVTTRSPEGHPVGVTANSFNSVSIDPPMVLWSLSKSANSRTAFTHSRLWAVHVLSAAQEALSARFATRGASKFEGLQVEEGLEGVPLLVGCVARLQCRTAFEYDGGDHIILVGEVIEFDQTNRAPLVFHAGQYAVAVSKQALPSRPDAADDREFSAEFTRDFLGYLLYRAHFGFYEKVCAHGRRYGFDGTELFLLLHLALWDGQSLAAMNEVLQQQGQHASLITAESLRSKGLLRLSPAAEPDTVCHLTEEGRQLALLIAADLKAIEADVLGVFDGAEAVLFKQYLRRLLGATGIRYTQ